MAEVAIQGADIAGCALEILLLDQLFDKRTSGLAGSFDEARRAFEYE
jgi:hypothetical protein